MKRKIINPVIQDTILFIQTSEASHAAITEMELTLMPGGSNFPHYHKSFTETFTAMEGVLGLRLNGNQVKMLQPGESCAVAPNQVHHFFNPGETEIRFNITITPGHKGFEYSLRILYGLAGDGFTNKKSIPRSLTHMAIIGAMSDSYLPGFMKIVSPLFNFLAKRAKKNGLEKQLVDRYCI